MPCLAQWRFFIWGYSLVSHFCVIPHKSVIILVWKNFHYLSTIFLTFFQINVSSLGYCLSLTSDSSNYISTTATTTHKWPLMLPANFDETCFGSLHVRYRVNQWWKQGSRTGFYGRGWGLSIINEHKYKIEGLCSVLNNDQWHNKIVFCLRMHVC